MQCRACGVEGIEGSLFCEECGSSLVQPADAGTDVSDSGLRCVKCGAGPGAVDADGFCTQCGHRRLPDPREHFEEVLAATVAGVSDIGLKYHENQDYFVLGEAGSGVLTTFVCDGVSRSQNSLEGSKVACDAALTSVCADIERGAGDPAAILSNAMARAQEAICRVPFERGLTEMVNGQPEFIPPAQAAIVGALVDSTEGRRITLAWLGDTRAYWIGAEGARQLTTDHSWFNDVVLSGNMTAEEAIADDRARGIVRSLGADLNGTNPGVTPDLLTLNRSEPGVLLIVSDGFYVYADDATIADLVGIKCRRSDALTMARRLVEFARSAGGRDNITVAVMIFET